MGRKRKDLNGLVFSRWTVVGTVESVVIKNKSRVFWLCRCECGVEKLVLSSNLVGGRSRSCGCLHKDWYAWNVPAVRHERHESVEYKMYNSARHRARSNGLPFNIDLADVVVPDTCPLLGIPIQVGKNGKAHAGSPTLDRIINEEGYVKGNVWVISKRANTIKNTANYQELELLANNLKEKVNNG